MKLFKFKDKKDKSGLTDRKDVIYIYIKKNLDLGVNIEKIKQDLEDGKEAGNYTSSDIEDALELFNENKKKEYIKKKEAEIKEMLKKIPKKQRKKAEKLYNLYLQGKVLQPNKNIDNKELMNKGSS